MLYDGANQQFLVYPPTLKKVEIVTNFTNPDDPSKMLEIQVQASSLVLLQEKSISFYKLASNNVTTGNYSCTAGDQMSFDSVAFDP